MTDRDRPELPHNSGLTIGTYCIGNIAQSQSLQTSIWDLILGVAGLIKLLPIAYIFLFWRRYSRIS